MSLYQSLSKSVKVLATPDAAGDSALDALLADYNTATGKSLIFPPSYKLLSVETSQHSCLLKAGDPMDPDNRKTSMDAVSLGVFVIDGVDYCYLELMAAGNNDYFKAQIMDAEGHSGYLDLPLDVRMASSSSDGSVSFRTDARTCVPELQFEMISSGVLNSSSSVAPKHVLLKSGSSAVAESAHRTVHAYGTGNSDHTKVYDYKMIAEQHEPDLASLLKLDLSVNHSVSYNGNTHQLGDIFKVDGATGMNVISCSPEEKYLDVVSV